MLDKTLTERISEYIARSRKTVTEREREREREREILEGKTVLILLKNE